ncbi:uncharacterized protein Tco025E_03432 [Trypanosoma conorhini]|uniref:Methyltransferase n=1 Tax=Trypanosoma conorhini TaxID=83891 RepID=A0A422PUF4_9TRYP|nr:uncharacterized protein Tco025E_03432 [Trypanosoma conorhini]RNF21352.1 hypothetical protein Tco025E_03432 [Trypanosoma conorhini]
MLRWVVKEVESPYGGVATVHWAVGEGGEGDSAATADACDASLQQQLEPAEDQLGAVLWNSNTVALRYLHEHVLRRERLAGCRVVELGAGVGCLGIALAMAGARVVVTDLKELVPLMQKNIELNAARIRARSNGQGSCAALALRWGPPPRPKKSKRQRSEVAPPGLRAKAASPYAAPSPSFLALQQALDRVDLVVLCDALYGNPRDWPQLLYTLSEILAANPNCEVVNFCEQRVDDVEGDFLRLLQRENSRSLPSAAAAGKADAEDAEEESLESALTRMRGAYEWQSSTESVREGTSDLDMAVRATRIRWAPRGQTRPPPPHLPPRTPPITAVCDGDEAETGAPRRKRRRTAS